MNFTALILEYLKQNGSVSVPGFGTFFLKNSNAVLDGNGSSILPPASEIAFRENTTFVPENFAKYVATRNQSKLIDAEIEIRKQVNFWNATLHKEKKLILDSIGEFHLDDSKIVFLGLRTENLSPDFYGLEEIKFSDIKNSRRKINSAYITNPSAWWIILLVVAVAALSYLGIAQPEEIFGKKSFPKTAEKKPLLPVKKDSIRTDSANAVVLKDSIHTDSLHAAVEKPAAKWTSNKYNSKWKKSKKRRNH